jgi:hypothetical protein
MLMSDGKGRAETIDLMVPTNSKVLSHLRLHAVLSFLLFSISSSTEANGKGMAGAGQLSV